MIDFNYLEDFAAGDRQVVDEVLLLFVQEAEAWSQSLSQAGPSWRDTVHTMKGSARGIGAGPLGDACERAEAAGILELPKVAAALGAALAAIAAYQATRR